MLSPYNIAAINRIVDQFMLNVFISIRRVFMRLIIIRFEIESETRGREGDQSFSKVKVEDIYFIKSSGFPLGIHAEFRGRVALVASASPKRQLHQTEEDSRDLLMSWQIERSS